MIDVQKYIDRLELLKAYMHLEIERRAWAETENVFREGKLWKLQGQRSSFEEFAINRRIQDGYKISTVSL